MSRTSGSPATSPAGRGSWHARANAVAAGYLIAALLAVPLPTVGIAPRWLVIHLFLLGAVTNAIVLWTRHFTVTLLHVPDPAPRSVAWQLAVLNGAVLAVLVGVTADWPLLAVSGAVLLAAVVVAHLGVLIHCRRQASGGRFTGPVRFYWVAAVALLAGIGLGTALAVGVPASWAARVYAAHVHVNLLGWVALTVLGTEFTLWPIVLRTRMVDGIAAAARRSLLLTTAGLTLTVTGLLIASRLTAVVGLAGYTIGVLCALDPFVRTARRKTPRSPAAWMLAAGTAWLVSSLATDIAALLTNPGPTARQSALAGLVPVLLTGFVAQTLIGALTYLLPVVLGRGPADGRRLAAVLDRIGPLRVAMFNAGVLLLALPLPAPAALTGWILVLAAVAGFLALAATALMTTPRTPMAGEPAPDQPTDRRSLLGRVGLGAVMLRCRSTRPPG